MATLSATGRVVPVFVVKHEDGQFAALPRGDRGWTDPLVVHRRVDRTSAQAVVFVHGLGGEATKTWGLYPEFVFRASGLDADVGLFDYESGLRRRPWRSISIPRQAEALAHYIRDLRYERVVLVGHSMGGLLCKAAIRSLLDSGTHDTSGSRGVDKVAGLVLFATPQSGSKRVPALFSRLSRDGRALRVGSSIAREAAQRFQDRIVTRTAFDTTLDRQHLPTFAVIAHGDFWVDPLSAGLGLDTDQQKIVIGSHRSIVRPASETDDAYMWFRDQVRWCLASRRMNRCADPDSGQSLADPDVALERIRRAVVETAQRFGIASTMHISVSVSRGDEPAGQEEAPDERA